jgi:hypothetical protein
VKAPVQTPVTRKAAAHSRTPLRRAAYQHLLLCWLLGPPSSQTAASLVSLSTTWPVPAAPRGKPSAGAPAAPASARRAAHAVALRSALLPTTTTTPRTCARRTRARWPRPRPARGGPVWLSCWRRCHRTGHSGAASCAPCASSCGPSRRTASSTRRCADACGSATWAPWPGCASKRAARRQACSQAHHAFPAAGHGSPAAPPAVLRGKRSATRAPGLHTARAGDGQRPVSALRLPWHCAGETLLHTNKDAARASSYTFMPRTALCPPLLPHHGRP